MPVHQVQLADVTAKFQKAPYGWDSICTLHIINELVRRHRRDYSYANNPNVDPAMVASRIMVETNKFTLRAAVAIPQLQSLQLLVDGFDALVEIVFVTSQAYGHDARVSILRISAFHSVYPSVLLTQD